MRVLRVQDKYIVGAKNRVGVRRWLGSSAGRARRKGSATLLFPQRSPSGGHGGMRPWYRGNRFTEAFELLRRKFSSEELSGRTPFSAALFRPPLPAPPVGNSLVHRHDDETTTTVNAITVATAVNPPPKCAVKHQKN